MNKVLKMKPIDQAVLTATEGNGEGVGQELPKADMFMSPPGGSSVAQALHALQVKLEVEDENKAEVRALIKQLILLNRDKKETYRRHAEARMERQAHNAAQGQIEADEREALIDREHGILFDIMAKSEGIHPGPISLAGERPPAPPRRKRSLWRRLLGLR